MDYRRTFRYVPPILLFVIVSLMVIVGINHVYVPLYMQGYKKTIIGFFIPLTFSLVMWLQGFFSLMFDDPGEMSRESRYVKNKNCDIRCKKCNAIKPYRAHHCSVCRKCFGKMDHHCLIIGKCVAIRNHKTFVVFLLHGILMTVNWFFVTLIMLKYGTDHFQLPFILDLFGSTSTPLFLGVLLGQQIYYIMSGRTLLEVEFDIPIKIEKTKLQLLEEVLGPLSFSWLIPSPTPRSTNAFQWEHLRPKEEKEEHDDEGKAKTE